MQPGALRRLDLWPKAAPPARPRRHRDPQQGRSRTPVPDRLYVEPDSILILAYIHERREPGYWLHRLNN